LRRRSCASRSRRASSGVDVSSGGTSAGRPSSSIATIVRYALFVCWTSPVRGFSASTRTPTSIDVRHTAFTRERKVTSFMIVPPWM
jgi:hypothetical protein